jgi:glycosyltransferase involved in cell wall biosynthesis
MPKISVIIPCYNYGQYIEEAIDSVLASTFNDYEIIVINDGSTDLQTIKILGQLNKPKTRVINQANQGLSIARNNGIKVSRGQYFLPLDADDTIEPTFLEKAYWILETNPNLGYVYPYVQLFGDEDWVWQTMEEYNYYKLLFDNHIAVCSLVRKKAWEEVGGYNPNMIYGYEDWEFWINLGKHGWYGQNIAEPLFNHRKHGVTMTKTAFKKRTLLIKQIKKNHPEIYTRKALTEFKKSWHINKSNDYYFVFGTRVVNSFFFPRKLKFLLKTIFLKGKKIIQNKVESKKQILDFNLIRDYQRINSEKTGILYIVPWLICGGSESFLYELISNLDSTKYQPIIVTTLKDQNIWQAKFQQFTPLIFHFPNLFTEIDFPNFISKLIEFYNIKIIHTSNSQMAYDFLGQIKKLRPAVMIIDTIHNDAPEAYLPISALNDSGIDIHVVVNSLIKDVLIKHYKIPQTKVELIYNGIDTTKFNPDLYNRTECLKLFSLPQNKIIVGYVGRFSQEKNPLGFLKILKYFENNPGILFVMAGNGNLFKKVQAKAKFSGLKDKIIFTGQVELMPEFLKCLDIIVNTSEIEGFSISILEAMSIGVPVIASNVGGTKELISQGINGYLIDDLHYKEFANKITAILDSVQVKYQISQNNRQKISQNFIAAKMAEQYFKLYERQTFS